MDPQSHRQTPRVAFRTNAGSRSGLGHLVRCVNLAVELREQGADCRFFVDFVEPGSSEFFQDFPVTPLYDSPRDEPDPRTDARRFLKHAETQGCSRAVLDDYRLAREWESPVRAAGLQLCVIDDLLRPHDCDLLVDMRWRGDDTRDGYRDRLPAEAVRLLGPGHALLAADYRQPAPARPDDSPFHIMVGLGGGGDLAISRQIVDCLLDPAEGFERPLCIRPVLGPLSGNQQAFLTHYRNRPEVAPIVGATDLYPHLRQCDLYIGAAGGLLYQLSALKIPTLSFALADNQRTDQAALDDIGHYFHVPGWSVTDVQHLPGFVATLMRHYRRIRRLCEQPRIAVDGYGARRVAEAMLGLPATSPAVVEAPARPEPAETQRLSPEHRLRPVDDRDINHYLASRNLPTNRNNMIGASRIPQMTHYRWWFETRRESWLLNRNGEPSLYIWHELKSLNAHNYLIGGWFVCGTETGFQDALLALDWQLRHCDRRFPNVPWIAVIQRRNRYVRQLNGYLGFQEIDPAHPHAPAIRALFGGADFADFHFVVREPAGTDPRRCSGSANA